MKLPLRPTNTGRLQRGMSLVELMVGIAVGLFVVAAAATLVANQLGDNRKLLLETQLQQDLRASMDIITRQLRRANASTAANVEAGIATSALAGGIRNAYVSEDHSAVNPAAFQFYFDASQDGPYGFQLVDGVIQTSLRRVIGVGASWQELTDPNTVVVEEFTVTPRGTTSIRLPCPKKCPDTTTNCWPQLVVRDFVVEIKAYAKSDPAIRRSLRNEVRVRNDVIKFNDTSSATSAVCPA